MGVWAIAKPFAHAAADREHVLQRPHHLGARHVVGRVDAEVRRRDDGLGVV